MPSQILLASPRFIPLGLLVFFLTVSVCLPLASQGAPTSSPSPAAASVVGPTPALDTYRINAGQQQGYQAGDRVRILRGDKALAEATVLRSASGTSEIVVRSSPAPRLLAGDRVEFVRRRPPLVEPRPGSAPHGVATSARSVAVGGGSLAPTPWSELGKVPGLLGADWMTRTTRYCQLWARKADCSFLDTLASSMDESYELNRAFMGIDLEPPVKVYFFSMAEPAHVQPMFASRLARYTRAAGVALSGLNTCVVNLGDARTSTLYKPWRLEMVCRHEFNHLFAFRGIRVDRLHTRPWFLEALAHTIEDTVRPPSTRLDLASMRALMHGYKAADASFSALIADRNNDDLEQYREYEKILVSVIFYLQDRYGNDVVARLVRTTAQGVDLEDAFIQVCGKGIKDLEVEWRGFYGIR